MISLVQEYLVYDLTPGMRSPEQGPTSDTRIAGIIFGEIFYGISKRKEPYHS